MLVLNSLKPRITSDPPASGFQVAGKQACIPHLFLGHSLNSSDFPELFAALDINLIDEPVDA